MCVRTNKAQRPPVAGVCFWLDRGKGKGRDGWEGWQGGVGFWEWCCVSSTGATASHVHTRITGVKLIWEMILNNREYLRPLNPQFKPGLFLLSPLTWTTVAQLEIMSTMSVYCKAVNMEIYGDAFSFQPQRTMFDCMLHVHYVNP